MKSKYQNTQDSIIIMATTTATDVRGDGSNPYRETIAVGYNVDHDNPECVIICQGNGCGDSRILADHDDDETISPDVLRDGAEQIRALANGHPHSEDLHELADYIMDQAAYHDIINNS